MINLKKVTAVSWFLLVLLSYPLAWLRLGGEKVAFFGDVKLFTHSELGIFSLCIILCFPEGITALFRRKRTFKYLCVSAGLLMFAALVRQFICRDNWINSGTALFYAATPLAAAALADELRKLLPLLASAGALFFLTSGIFSVKFTGLTGNWNWTQGICAALIPGIFYLLYLKNPLCYSLGSCVIFFILLKISSPEILSRAAVCAVAGTAAVCAARKFIQERFIHYLPVILWLGTAAVFLAAVQSFDLNDSRFQLWRGALNLAADFPLCGIGTEKFIELIPPYLPEKYFFTPFAASLHPHPHNIILHYLISFGIAGVIYNFALFGNVVACRKNRVNDLALWIFTVLFICGLFDMTADIVTGAWWMLTAAGIAAADGAESAESAELLPVPLLRPRLLAAAALAILLAAAANFRSTSMFRKGKLAETDGNYIESSGYFDKSLSIKPLREVFYENAALSLHFGNDPQKTLYLLKRMREESGCENYLHSNRLLSVAYFRSGDIAAAKRALDEELCHFPYSIINARLNILLLEKLNAPRGEIAAAVNRLIYLCGLRKIKAADAVEITPAEDDAPLPSGDDKMEQDR